VAANDQAPSAPGIDRPCPHFPDCVGCTLIGKPYGEQLRIKRQRVVEAFSRFPSLADVCVPAVKGAPRAFGYRNQAKLVVRQARRGLLLGIYRPGSHQVVDIRQCPVHHPLITRVIAVLAEAVERYRIPAYDERTGVGTLRYAVVRVSNWAKTAQVILVTHGGELPRARQLVEALRRVRALVSVVQNINPEPGNVIFGPRFVPLTREAALIDRVGSLRLRTHAGAFLQANIPVARKLYTQALQWAAVEGGDVAADLYCGVGGMTFSLAAAAQLVVGIEASPVAVADAKANVRINGFHNVRFYCGEAAALLPELAQRLQRVDVVTLNPPRKGADSGTRAAIAACTPRRVVYIACDPDTLARDLDWFAAHGYRAVGVQPFDLLPQTEHVECVAALAKEAVSDRPG
jgi:23S rRNA (uracil1939-C5)-methyltransferase